MPRPRGAIGSRSTCARPAEGGRAPPGAAGAAFSRRRAALPSTRSPRARRGTPPIDTPSPPPTPLVDYESKALERSSYITAVVHLYRGEVSRANAWRQRLDQTTNWAVFVTATALGFAFGNEEAHHLSLQFVNLTLFLLLALEARRFRFFDVWRARVRKIETNFFAPILERDLRSPERSWAHLVAGDLATPHFHLSRLQALRLRLVRNYLAIFLVVFLGWVIKLWVHPEPAHSLGEVYERCAVQPVPGWVTLTVVAAFYGTLTAILALGRAQQRSPTQDDWDIGERVDAPG